MPGAADEKTNKHSCRQLYNYTNTLEKTSVMEIEAGLYLSSLCDVDQ